MDRRMSPKTDLSKPSSLPICLYCLRSDRAFTSVGHVVPESLGNTSIMLSKGTVCDQCNNNVLARLDNALLKFDPIAFMKVHQNIQTKAGKLPSASFHGVTIEAKSRSHVHTVVGPDASLSTKPTTEGGLLLPPGVENLHFSFRGKSVLTRNYLKLLSRSIFKITLPELSLSHRFDEIRSIIRGRSSFHGFLDFADQALPHDHVSITYDLYEFDSKPLTPVLLDFYGVQLFTEIEQRVAPDAPGPPGSTVLCF